MSDTDKPKTVSNAFHGEGDADAGVVTVSVVVRDEATKREAGKTAGGGAHEEADPIGRNEDAKPGP